MTVNSLHGNFYFKTANLLYYGYHYLQVSGRGRVVVKQMVFPLFPPGAVTQSCSVSLSAFLWGIQGGCRHDTQPWKVSSARSSALETQWVPISHFMSTNNPLPLYTAHLSLHSNDSPCFASLLFLPFSLLLPLSVLVQECFPSGHLSPCKNHSHHTRCHPPAHPLHSSSTLFRVILQKIQIWPAVALPESKHLREHRTPPVISLSPTALSVVHQTLAFSDT